jgi:hypothetical protein
VKKVVEAVSAWFRHQIAVSDPVTGYLAGAVDLVDLEHRMRAIQRGEVRGLYTRRY